MVYFVKKSITYPCILYYFCNPKLCLVRSNVNLYPWIFWLTSLHKGRHAYVGVTYNVFFLKKHKFIVVPLLQAKNKSFGSIKGSVKVGKGLYFSTNSSNLLKSKHLFKKLSYASLESKMWGLPILQLIFQKRHSATYFWWQKIILMKIEKSGFSTSFRFLMAYKFFLCIVLN